MKRFGALGIVLVCALIAASESSAQQQTQFCDGLPLTWCSSAHLNFTGRAATYVDYDDKDTDQLINIRLIKSQRWYKPTAFFLWLGAGIKTWNDDGRIKLKNYLGREPSANVTFTSYSGQRYVFAHRSFPVILVPLGKDARIDHAVAFQISRKESIVFSYMISFPRRRN